MLYKELMAEAQRLYSKTKGDKRKRVQKYRDQVREYASRLSTSGPNGQHAWASDLALACGKLIAASNR